MFPEETHVEIVRRIDAMESEMYGFYRKLEHLRLDLQRKWRVLPNGERWSEQKHAASQYSSGASGGDTERTESVRTADAVATNVGDAHD